MAPELVCSDNGYVAKKKQKRNFQRTFIKEWREFRNMTQERLAERIGRTTGLISQIENGLGPYTQETLEAIADALLCQPADLLMRNPKDPDAIWSIWDQLEPVKKRQAIGVLKAIKEAS